jgi:uncharacterized membrane protein
MATKFDARDLSLFALFAGLYTVINIIQMTVAGGYTIYGPIQLRVADCLIALSALLGWPIVAGVTVGCFLTNAYYFLGPLPLDIILGPIANLIAASFVLLLRRRQLSACVIGSLLVGLIVGGYMWTYKEVFAIPASLEFLPAWAAAIVLLTISSLIAIAVIGYALLKIMTRPSIIGSLKSHGLKTLS